MNAENDETRKAQGAERTSVGTQLSGIYELDERIASGGMGEVFRGHNIQTGDHVAIKIVLPEFARDQTILSLFRKEASILNHLSHDAVVRYHVFTVDPGIGRPYLAMEFVNGQSLFDVLLRGPLSPADVRKLCHRLASGLSAVHEAGAVHRDLSPDNVILPGGRVDRAKIIDFGIARLATVGGETLIGGKFAGKYNYVSPEQLGLYGGEVSERSDIYSLGLVLAAALRGRPIDMGGSQLEVVDKRRCVPDLSDIDGDLRPIIEMMLQPDPADRLGSMAEIADMTRTVVPQDLDQTLVSKSATMRGRPGGLPQAAQLALAHPVADGAPTKNGQGQVGAASPAKPEVRRLVARKRPAHLSNPRSSAAVTTEKTPRAPQAKHSMGARIVTIMSLLTLVVAAGAGAYLGGFIPPLAQLAGSSKSETAPFKPDLSKVSQSEGTPAIDQPVKATPQPSTPIGPEGSSTKAPSTNQMAAKTDQNTAAVQGPPKAPVPQSVAAKTPSVSADQSIATGNKDHQPPPAQNNQAQNLQMPGAALVPATTQPGSTAAATKTPPVSADQSIATSNKDRQPAPAQNNQAQNLQTPGAALVPATTQPGSTAAATKTPPVSADQSIATSNKDRQPPLAQNNQAQNVQTPGAALVPATTQPGSTAAATKTPPVSADQSVATSNKDRQPALAQNNQAQNLQMPGAALVPATTQPGSTAAATKTPPLSADQSIATSNKDRQPPLAQNNQAQNLQTPGAALVPATTQPGSTAAVTKTPSVSADQSITTSNKDRQPAPAQNNQAQNLQTPGAALVPATIQPGSTAAATKKPPLSADQSVATSNKDRQPPLAQNNQAQNLQTPGAALVPTTIQPGSTAAATKKPPLSADQSVATSNKDRQPPLAQNNQAANRQTPGAALVPTTTQPGSTAAPTKTPPVSADQSVATSNKDRQPAPAQNNQAQNLQTLGAALVPTTIQPGSTAAVTKTPSVSADQSIATSNKDRQPAPAQNNQAQNLQTPGAALVPTTIQPGSTAGPGGGKPAADKVKEDTVALNVPPTQTPAVLGVDEAGERIAWLRAYNGGDCFYAAVTSSTDKVANIEGFGTAEAPFDGMRQAFQAKFHIQPDISPQIIAPGQCGVVSFLRSLGGTPAHAPKLVLDRTSVLSGAPISGSLETNGGLLSHLFLIDHKGTAFNLDARITVQFGKANFSIPIGLGAADRAAGKALPQILLVITGPDSIQSANFTTPMPASAVLAKILAEIRVKGSTFSATAKYFRLGE